MTTMLDQPAVARRLAPQMWGRSVRDLHDEIWATRGVTIIRRGERGARGDGMHLLLEADQLVHGAALLQHAAKRRPRLFHLTGGMAGHGDGRVRTTPAGHLAGIERRYTDDATVGTWVLMTRDVEIIHDWTAGTAPRIVTRARGRNGGCDGWQLDRRDAHAADRWLQVAVTEGCPAAIEGVQVIAPDVWAPANVTLPPEVTLIGPAWIGEGVNLATGDLVIGPCVLRDGLHADALAGPMLLTPPPIETGRAGWWRLGGKRVFDVVVAALLLLLFAPILPVIMLLIAREDGRPIFFTHTRQGRGGRPFPCFKFRTMVNDAEGQRRDLADCNHCDGPQFYLPEDPRLLRVGHWLRRTNLDELPQLWNVIRGEMSLVGPRPSPEHENQCCRPWREARLSVRPGITGLWQVHRTRDRGKDFQEWIRYDCEYVRRITATRDLRILALTARKLFTQLTSALRRQRSRHVA